MEKKVYVPPTLNALGSVSDLTQTGQTQPGGDPKQGSVVNPGNQL